MALLASRFRVVSELVTPLAAAVNAMPIIALAPMFNNMFSIDQQHPPPAGRDDRRVLPDLRQHAAAGSTQVDARPRRADALATRPATGRSSARSRVPGALPFFFTGLKLAASLGVIAAVVAEYFGGLQNGLGSRITSAAAATAYARAWAYVAAVLVLGLVFYLAAVLLERVATPWQAHRRA